MPRTKGSTNKVVVQKVKLKYGEVKNWIWDYFEDTIKIFVPQQLKLSFQKFIKANKLHLIQACVYTVENSNDLKKNPSKYMFKIGKDYICPNEHKNILQGWLKMAIKEL